MQRKNLLLGIAVALGVAVAAVAGWHHQSRSVLWRIVSSDCAHIAASGGDPPKCSITPAHEGAPGYALLKDRRGVAQYLLIPTQRVTGIEDPALLAPGEGRLLADAWNERGLAQRAVRLPMPREDVSLALNSAWSRSQDQLHVHIDCVRADLRAYLESQDAHIGSSWAPLPGGWNGHAYAVKRLVAPTLDGTDLFHELAQQHPDEMGRQSIAVVGSRFQDKPSFWLLQSSVDFFSGWMGGIEGDVQDHDCEILGRGQPAN